VLFRKLLQEGSAETADPLAWGDKGWGCAFIWHWLLCRRCFSSPLVGLRPMRTTGETTILFEDRIPFSSRNTKFSPPQNCPSTVERSAVTFVGQSFGSRIRGSQGYLPGDSCGRSGNRPGPRNAGGIARVTLPSDPRNSFISSKTWAYRDAGRDHFVEPDMVFVVLHVECDWLGWNERIIGVVAGRDREVLVLAVPLLSTG
jgi:hypothetical protein